MLVVYTTSGWLGIDVGLDSPCDFGHVHRSTGFAGDYPLIGFLTLKCRLTCGTLVLKGLFLPSSRPEWGWGSRPFTADRLSRE